MIDYVKVEVLRVVNIEKGCNLSPVFLNLCENAAR